MCACVRERESARARTRGDIDARTPSEKLGGGMCVAVYECHPPVPAMRVYNKYNTYHTNYHHLSSPRTHQPHQHYYHQSLHLLRTSTISTTTTSLCISYAPAPSALLPPVSASLTHQHHQHYYHQSLHLLRTSPISTTATTFLASVLTSPISTSTTRLCIPYAPAPVPHPVRTSTAHVPIFSKIASMLSPVTAEAS